MTEKVIFNALSVIALGSLLTEPLPARDPGKPNVLFIAVDDLNDWVGCLGGHPQTETPNIDRLAERGMLFTNAHCQGTMCNPSRISLLWGAGPPRPASTTITTTSRRNPNSSNPTSACRYTLRKTATRR